MRIEEIIGNELRGCALLWQDNRVLFHQAFGYADLPNEVPNTTETRFATASAGKVFVAVGILQLIEAGRLRFNDTLGQLLDMDLHQIDREVTVKQLLTHTSGVPDYFDESIMTEYEDLWKDYPNYKIRSNADLLPLFIHKPMLYGRGERFQYNNTGFVLLGMIIEKISGITFDRYLEEKIFCICGMKSTGYYELDRLPAKCAANYIYDKELKGYRTNIFSVDAKGTGAGGAFTTTGDILRFWNALLANKLLSREMTSHMLTVQSGNPESGYYGYGIWLKKLADGSYYPYFQGCDPGVSFISAYNPQSNICSVLVSNYGDNVWKLMRSINEDVEKAKNGTS